MIRVSVRSERGNGKVPESPHGGSAVTKWVIATLVMLAGGVCLFQAMRGPSSGRPIKIVLPDAYAGPFSIVKDRRRGAELASENGVWVFEIPADGVLVVKDDAPFYQWHAQWVVDRSGRDIQVRELGTRPGKIKTGANSSSASTDFDGTTHRWEVVSALRQDDR